MRKENLIDVLNKCYKDKRSLIAFNLQNLYHLEAIKQVTEKLKLPVIVQFSARYVTQFEKRLGFDFMNKRYKNEYMYFHLDHCQDFELIKFCVDSDFDGVMYDGSASPIDENIAFTKKVTEYAYKHNCIVEGELGEIGGVEDGVGTEGMAYANLSEVKKYVDETSVDLLALGIGNAHGFYTSLEHINTSILLKAKEIIGEKQLFVLHGGSGLPTETINETIHNGVVKINFSTQIKQATNDGIQNYMNTGKLYNEVAFEKEILAAVMPVFEELIIKYTK